MVICIFMHELLILTVSILRKQSLYKAKLGFSIHSSVFRACINIIIRAADVEKTSQTGQICKLKYVKNLTWRDWM